MKVKKYNLGAQNKYGINLRGCAGDIFKSTLALHHHPSPLAVEIQRKNTTKT
jgi:hypothetical protein